MSRSQRSTEATRFTIGVAIVVALVVAVIWLRRDSTPKVAPRLVDDPKDDTPAMCAEGLAAVPGGGCYAAPAARTAGKALPLVLFLHGRYAPDAVDKMMETQARVARIALAHGHAVLALQGRQGECTDPSLATWWCWPSNERNAQDGPAFVQRFGRAIAEAEKRGGKGRRVLLGFSNGAYFAALIAATGVRYFDAVAVAHGGPGGAGNVAPRDAMVPMLLLSSDGDPANTDMVRLQGALTAVRWPFVGVSTNGGHFLSNWDIDTALTFFARSQEKLPLTPPLAGRSITSSPPPPAAPEPEAPSALSDPPTD